VSLVFDARRRAERSKRAREVSEIQRPTDPGPLVSGSQDIPPGCESKCPEPTNREQAGPRFGVEMGHEQASTRRVARADAAWAKSAAITDVGSGKQTSIVRSLLRAGRSVPPSEVLARSNVAEQSWAPDGSVQHSGQIEPATLISRTNPVYPASAEGRPVSGSVQVHFRISPEGKVYNAKFIQGPAILARAAIEAVETWCYEPARLYGAPVDSHASTILDFKLD
jgi:TonB family protein